MNSADYCMKLWDLRPRGRSSTSGAEIVLVIFHPGGLRGRAWLYFEWPGRAVSIHRAFADDALLHGMLAFFRDPWKIRSEKIKSNLGPS